VQEIDEQNNRLTFTEIEIFGTSNIFFKFTIYF
jgi:hypothetical protein